MKASEHVILVDRFDQEIGYAEKLFAHQNRLLHRAFSVFIFRKMQQFELLLQRRALNKYHSADLWSNTCCSHPRAQENMLAAGQRRLFEELNISVAELQDIGWFHYSVDFSNGLTENEIDHVLLGVVGAEVDVVPNPAEVSAYRWITLPQLEHEMDVYPHQFTPWLRQALALVKDCSLMHALEEKKDELHDKQGVRIIILDRDGVINYESQNYIKSPAEWQPIPGSLEAIALLTQAGYTVVVATNQSGVGRGYYTEAVLAQINQKMMDYTREKGGCIDRVFYCPHCPEEGCHCRKPAVGLFEQIAAAYSINLQHSFAIGDSLRDIQAAAGIGCRPVLVLTGNGEETLKNNPDLMNDVPIFPNLLTAVKILLKKNERIDECI